MAGDVVHLTRRAAPAWGGWVSVVPADLPAQMQGVRAFAEVTAFWGSDDLEVPERLSQWAQALRRLADDLDKAAVDMGDA